MISVENFRTWQKDPVTENFIQALKDYESKIDKLLCEGTLIMDADGAKKLARYLGQRDMIHMILNISVDDLNPEVAADVEP